MIQAKKEIPLDFSVDNERFGSIFRRWGIAFLLVNVVFVFSTSYAILNSNPLYWQDWRAPAIILLSLAILCIYAFRTFDKTQSGWPLPLLYASSIWISMYVGVIGLIFIDRSFAWYLYVLFGLTFSMFQGRSLYLCISVVFLSFCACLGLFSWPFDWGNISGILGIGLSTYGTATFSTMLQRLIGERYERNRLLQKLTTANMELAEAHRQLAANALQERELAVLRERTRLAREVHDTVGSALVLISVKLEAIQRLRERDPQRCERELEATKEVVRGSMKELRASIAKLRSPLLMCEAASQALHRYAQEMAQRTGICVSYDLQLNPSEGLPEQIEEVLWKVGQEALTNVEKHAAARNVVVHMSRQQSVVRLRIEDDGVGLPQELLQGTPDEGDLRYSSPPGHYGLSGMVERVESIGGSIVFYRAAERGTIVEVDLPLVEISL